MKTSKEFRAKTVGFFRLVNPPAPEDPQNGGPRKFFIAAIQPAPNNKLNYFEATPAVAKKLAAQRKQWYLDAPANERENVKLSFDQNGVVYNVEAVTPKKRGEEEEDDNDLARVVRYANGTISVEPSDDMDADTTEAIRERFQKEGANLFEGDKVSDTYRIKSIRSEGKSLVYVLDY